MSAISNTIEASKVDLDVTRSVDDPWAMADMEVKTMFDESPSYRKTMELIESRATAPPCSKFATMQLLQSCRFIKGGTSNGYDTYDLLEEKKDIYAARMAMCEVSAGNVKIPPQCKPIASTPVRTLQQGQLEFVARKSVVACIQAYQVKPELWWTSYVSHRREASTMCSISRGDIEEAELLNTARQLFDAFSDTIQIIGRSKQQMDSFMDRQFGRQQDLGNLQDDFDERVRRSVEAVETKVGSSANAVEAKLRSIGDTLQHSLHGSFMNAESLRKVSAVLEHGSLANLKQSVNEVVIDLLRLKDDVLTTTTGHSDLVLRNAEQLQTIYDVAARALATWNDMDLEAGIEVSYRTTCIGG